MDYFKQHGKHLWTILATGIWIFNWKLWI